MDIRKNRRIGVALRVLVVFAVAAAAWTTGCATDDGVSVAEKVKYDFGIGEKPEGYETATDRVMARLEDVGKAEMNRMNSEQRHGEVKFQQQNELQGQFYKETKRYESYLVLDARAVTRSSQKDRGYVGFIEYTYQIYQGERRPTSAEAAAQPANIATTERGRETLRYNFGSSGNWDGAPGEPARM